MTSSIDQNPNSFSNASEAWEFLAGATDYEKMSRFGKGRADWDLTSIRRLLDSLGRPDRGLPVVQIGGSKGKGSVARLVDAALREAGAVTGLYTSPHVDHPLERIQVAGSSISEATFARWMNAVHPALAPGGAGSIDRTGPTFFEIFTALAIAIFAEAQTEIAILEVGLGGPLDATSAVDATRLSVITSISRDHTHLLGETTRAIAADKAGIFRAGVTAVVGTRPGEAAFSPLREAAERVGAPLIVRGRDFDVMGIRPTPHGQELDIEMGSDCLRDVEVALLGPFQATNAAVAFAAIRALERTGGPAVSDDAIRSAWRKVRVPGRLEVLKRDPLLVADGAHNRASALALLEALSAHCSERPIHLVLAMAGDKLVAETAEPLIRAADRIHVTRTDNPRSLDPAFLAELARTCGKAAEVHATVPQAMKAALEGAPPDAVVVATGSLYLAGEVRAWAGFSNLGFNNPGGSNSSP
jgi:dihydrofolate synthase/folylpolyglutamate synthase